MKLIIMTQQDIKLNVDEELKNEEKFLIFKLFGEVDIVINYLH